MGYDLFLRKSADPTYRPNLLFGLGRQYIANSLLNEKLRKAVYK